MKKRYLLAVLPALAWPFAACDVRQTEEGKAPDVDVEPGRLPEYQVTPPEVDIQTDTTQIIVPDVNIRTPGDTSADTIR